MLGGLLGGKSQGEGGGVVGDTQGRIGGVEGYVGLAGSVDAIGVRPRSVIRGRGGLFPVW